MFDKTPLAPADPVFGLIEQYKLDQNPEKINLSVGVYQNEAGQTPVMQAVQQAEQILLDAKGTKSYLPIHGSVPYNELVAELMFGPSHSVIQNKRFATAQTPGGTGALRVAGDLLRTIHSVDTIWICNPTWANHGPIYLAAGLKLERYDYLNDSNTALDFDRMLTSLADAKAGQAILLHTVCHNPSGFDLSAENWDSLFQLIQERGLIPIFDFAYQGFAEGLDVDAQPIRKYCEKNDAIICQSFSKNFGLYGERVGTVTAVGKNAEVATALLSQIKRVIRTAYSNPPRHGAEIVQTVLSDGTLRKVWETELTEMRNRIGELRKNFVAKLDELTPNADFSYIPRQRGMFSYSGLEKEQVNRLREEYSIYIVGSGRVNIAGVNANNNDRICQAIAAVV